MKTQTERWIMGVALAAALPALLPIIRETASPLMKRGSRLMQQTARRAAAVAVKARHELEDIWLEAETERLQRRLKTRTPAAPGGLKGW